ncbi:MAG: hypothetical protein ACI8Y7_000295 [Candidatus Woesearchaeota archaeon]|jgi:hypothetical protein
MLKKKFSFLGLGGPKISSVTPPRLKSLFSNYLKESYRLPLSDDCQSGFAETFENARTGHFEELRSKPYNADLIQKVQRGIYYGLRDTLEKKALKSLAFPGNFGIYIAFVEYCFKSGQVKELRAMTTGIKVVVQQLDLYFEKNALLGMYNQIESNYPDSKYKSEITEIVETLCKP